MYLILATPALLYLSVSSAPLQVPDETSHLYRAAQLLQGEWIAQKIASGTAGGHVDSAVAKFAQPFYDIAGLPDAKITPAFFEHGRKTVWGGDLVEVGFANTALYPPTFYLAQAAALAIAQSLHLDLLDSLYLARIANALFAMAIGAFSLHVARRGRLLLFVLLMLPMTLNQFASASQDAGLIAVSVLVAALATRARDAKSIYFWCCAACIAAVASSRLPLVTLIALIWLPGWSGGEGQRSFATRRFAATAISAGSVLLWLTIVSSLRVQMRLDVPTTAAPQLAVIFAQPIRFAKVIVDTLYDSGEIYWETFVGRFLGHFNAPLSSWGWSCARLALSLGLLQCILEPHVTSRRADRWYSAAVIAASILSMLVVFYLVWTPVGAERVEGVQGRYFLCIAPLLVLAVPRLKVPSLSLEGRLRPLYWLIAIAGVGAASVATVSAPVALAQRFYNF